jgi:DNA-directed RNA polymerase specialized sigma24 family protein
MGSTVISKDEFMAAYRQYETYLLCFLADFTQDEATAHKIMDEALWKWLATAESPHASRFTQLSQITRLIAIEKLQKGKTTPYSERKYFQFSDNLTAKEKEIFSQHYFQGISREDIATAFNIPLAQVKALICKAVKDIGTQLYK